MADKKETARNTFEIPEPVVYRLDDWIVKMNKRAARLGLEPLVAETVSKSWHHIEDSEGFGFWLLTVKISGTSPKLNGWMFAGTIDHNINMKTGGKRNVLRAVPEVELPVSFRTVEERCDHCNAYRQRKNTYIIHNEETGDWKQVGSTCIRDYLGHKDAGAVGRYLEDLLETLEGMMEEFSLEEIAELLFSGGEPAGPMREAELFSLDVFLRICYRAIYTYGFMSRSRSEQSTEYEKPRTTGDRVASYMFALPQYRDSKLKNRIDGEDEAVDAAISWVRGLEDEDLDSNYLYNLAAVCGNEAIPFKHFGLAASLLSAHGRVLETERKAADRPVSEYVGTVKKRMAVDALTLVWDYKMDGYYGISFVYKFEDAAGNVYVWKTGKRLDGEGTVYSGKATVKEHSEYESVKQTVLTRCSFKVIKGKEVTCPEDCGRVYEVRDGQIIDPTSGLDYGQIGYWLCACEREEEAA